MKRLFNSYFYNYNYVPISITNLNPLAKGINQPTCNPPPLSLEVF